MHRYWATTCNEWFIRFLLEFPTPAHVRSLSKEAFVLAAWDLVGRKVNKRGAEEVLSGNSSFEHLKTLSGVGSVIALTILAKAGDVKRFAHHRQFLKYCGFDLAKQQSGTQRGREHLSKHGNARLRLAFWIAGVGAVFMRENSFRDKYERYIKAAPGDADLHRKALTAVAAKMAHVAYSIVKTNQPYRRFFEQALPSGSISLSVAVGAHPTS